jgi:hypothetical protein
VYFSVTNTIKVFQFFNFLRFFGKNNGEEVPKKNRSTRTGFFLYQILISYN